MKNVFILAKLKSRVNALNDVSELSVRRSKMTEMNPAIAELVKKRAQILETMNPRIRIREISFLKTKTKRNTALIWQSGYGRLVA